MNSYENHVDYVTSQVKLWYDNVMSYKIRELCNTVREENAKAASGHPDFESDDTTDTAWLADEMEDFAIRQMVDVQESSVIKSLLSDALSEADWHDLAYTYLHPEKS